MGIGGVGNTGYVNTIYLDVETMEAQRKLSNGQFEPIPAQEKEKLLADAGLSLSNNTIIDTYTGDSFEIKSPTFNSSLSVGGPPQFSENGTLFEASAPDVRAACELMENMELGTNSLLLTQLLTLLKITQDEKKSNDDMLQNADALKILAKDGEIAAKQQQAQAQADKATEELFVACGTAIGKVACAIIAYNGTPAKDDPAKPKTEAQKQKEDENARVYQLFNPLANSSMNVWKSVDEASSYLYGAKNDEQKAKAAEVDAQTQGEVIGQLQNAIKEGSKSIQTTYRNAIQLLKEVAQRQTENIKAMTSA